MDILTHEEFWNQYLTQYINGQIKKGDAEVDLVPPYTEKLCPEPVTFLRDFDDISDDSQACRQKFQGMVRGFADAPRVPLNPKLWYNRTRTGINLRPGVYEATRNPNPVKLGDVCVHGLLAGQTGSGKSVLLNNLLFNALSEYAPWELDLYLADFKKVEFSRYMNKKECVTPHVKACAATSEIRYVISLIEYLVDCMNAREEFFSRLGCDKIANFRDQYHVVLPRILLVVDEFQQMFLDASPKEGEQIRQMLTAIVKKGRATGLHVLFASQEMSQTLSRSDLANFRLRIALNCTANVSVDILGNRGASRLQRGYCLVNISDGSENTNMQFRVPMIETEAPAGKTPYFDDFLSQLHGAAERFGAVKGGKFYKEDEQRPISALESLLERIKSARSIIFTDQKREYFEVLTLGRYVTYSNRKYDIQTLFLSRGTNRNILVVSPGMDNLTYLQRLLAVNFVSSPRAVATGVGYRHRVYSLQPVVRNLYQVEKCLGTNEVYTSVDDLMSLAEEFETNRFHLQLFQECETAIEMVITNHRRNLDALRKARRNDLADHWEKTETPRIAQIFGNPSLEEVPGLCARIRQEYRNQPQILRLAENLEKFARYKRNPDLAFQPTVYWISGIDCVENIPNWLLNAMKNSMDFNSLFILMASSEFDYISQVARHCDYLFLSGNNRRIYDRLNVNFTHKEADSIALDLYIKSDAEERSFKKYKVKSAPRRTSPRIDFDLLLGKGVVKTP